jgi:hypothetical protein
MKHEEQLRRMFININDWLKFAEAKNLGLLTLSAAIVFGFLKANISPVTIAEKMSYYVLIPLAVLSFVTALISVFPIITDIERGKKIKGGINWLSNLIDKEHVFENIHFYGYLRSININAFESEYLKKTNSADKFTEYEKELGIQILYNSRITALKYQFFKVGAFLLFVGVCTTSVAFLASHFFNV